MGWSVGLSVTQTLKPLKTDDSNVPLLFSVSRSFIHALMLSFSHTFIYSFIHSKCSFIIYVRSSIVDQRGAHIRQNLALFLLELLQKSNQQLIQLEITVYKQLEQLRQVEMTLCKHKEQL